MPDEITDIDLEGEDENLRYEHSGFKQIPDKPLSALTNS